jgi:transcriptional regulator with XRE-family HTH domain
MSFKADSDKIKRWREERHWSQEHLAELAGLGLRTVQRIENGDGASNESLMALAVAYNVDVIALAIDPEHEAREIVQRKNAKIRAGARLSLWISLASYAFGVILFIGISWGMNAGVFVMKWPLIWWTVGAAAHALTVGIIELATRYEDG